MIDLIKRYADAAFLMVLLVIIISAVALANGKMTGAEFAWLSGVLTLAFNVVQALIHRSGNP